VNTSASDENPAVPARPDESAEQAMRDAARSFVGAAFDQLREVKVIPTPIYHRFIHVGRDYFGDDVRGPELYALERAIEEAFPERFADDVHLRDREFASSYAFSFLEACVARCGGREQRFDSEAAGVTESIDELIAVLRSESSEVVCCRFVGHLTTTSGEPVRIGDVEVVPEMDERAYRELQHRIAMEIPSTWMAFNRGDPFVFEQPHALLIARQTSTGDPYALGHVLSGSLERFQLIARLLTAGTVHSYFEVFGPTTLVSRVTAVMETFRESGLGMSGPIVRRTVRLDGSEGPAFEALGALIDAADVERAGMAATSFDVAINKFRSALRPGPESEQLVDLATALEAILASGDRDNEGLTLRLRNRTAALLATERDSGKDLFDDVGELYKLRSKLVHGGQIKEAELRRIVGRVSTVSPETVERGMGVAVGFAVDRMRDLVRRAILARLCLASEPDPVWPFTRSTPVDAMLSDDAARARWRERWHGRLAELGVAAAAQPPRSAVDFLSPEDR